MIVRNKVCTMYTTIYRVWLRGLQGGASFPLKTSFIDLTPMIKLQLFRFEKAITGKYVLRWTENDDVDNPLKKPRKHHPAAAQTSSVSSGTYVLEGPLTKGFFYMRQLFIPSWSLAARPRVL